MGRWSGPSTTGRTRSSGRRHRCIAVPRVAIRRPWRKRGASRVGGRVDRDASLSGQTRRTPSSRTARSGARRGQRAGWADRRPRVEWESHWATFATTEPSRNKERSPSPMAHSRRERTNSPFASRGVAPIHWDEPSISSPSRGNERGAKTTASGAAHWTAMAEAIGKVGKRRPEHAAENAESHAIANAPT